MSSKRPWMPLYIDDYLAGTTHLEAHEHGAYLLLMMRYWSKGGLPSDDETLRKIARLSLKQWKKSKDALQFFFNDGWRHQRIDAELAQAIEKSRVNSANASKSHKPRNQVAPVSPPVSQPTLQTPDSTVVSKPPIATRSSPQPEIQPVPIPVPPNSLGSQLPETWVPDDEGTNHAEMLGLDPNQQLLRFHAHHASIGTWSTDWSKCWTKWCCDNAPPPAARAVVVVNTEPPKPKRKRGFPLPDDWTPTAEHAVLAKKEGVDLDREAAKFRNYCANNPHKYSKHNQAFSNFLMSDFNRGGSNGFRQAAKAKGSIIKAADEFDAELDQRIAALEAIEGDRQVGEGAVLVLSDHRLRRS